MWGFQQPLASRPNELRFVIVEVDRAHRFRAMQTARLSCRSRAVPIENAISRVAVFLNLDEQISPPDRVQPAAGTKKPSPFLTGDAIPDRLPSPSRHRLLESARGCTPLRRPAKISAPSSAAAKYHISVFASPPSARRHFVRGMDLQGKLFPRVEQLGENGKARRLRHVRPEDRIAMFDPQFMQGSPAPRPLPNDALRFRPVNDLPRFTDLFPRRKPFAKRLSSRRPPQIRSMKRGSKTSGCVGGIFISGGET